MARNRALSKDMLQAYIDACGAERSTAFERTTSGSLCRGPSPRLSEILGSIKPA